MIDQLIHFKSFVLTHTADDASSPDVENLSKVLEMENNSNPEAKIYGISKDSTDVFVYVTDKNGVILLHSKYPEMLGTDYRKWRNIYYALDGQYGARTTRHVKDAPETSVMHVTHPLYKRNEIIGTLTVAKPASRLSHYLNQTRDKVLKQTILTLVLFLGLGYILMKRIVDPIEKLTVYVDKIRNKGNASLPKLPEGELTLLAQTIDDMRREIDGKNYIESYVEGMTHELKSPISAIQGAAELIEEEALADNKHLLKNIKKESQRMGEMIEQLLLLSRLENASNEKLNEKFDFSELIVNLHRDFSERHPDRKILLSCDDDIKFKGDQSLISTAIQNLINNALEFSDDDSEVILEVTQDKKSLELKVKDQGVGIPDYAVNKVFEKFYSLPRPDTGRKSSGLGLSITRQIAEMYGGSVKLEATGEGTVATLIFK